MQEAEERRLSAPRKERAELVSQLNKLRRFCGATQVVKTLRAEINL